VPEVALLNINLKKNNMPALIKKLITGVINIKPVIIHDESAMI